MQTRLLLPGFSPWSADRLFYTFLLLLVSISTALAQTPTIRYVKAGGTGNGSAWTNASGDLQAMINASASGDQVWVATGTYKPTSTSNRTISFAMKNGVAIYGGFVGTETTLNQRVLTRPLSTTLSGELGDPATTADNSYHVISNPVGLTTTAVLDGFVITGGNANGSVSPDDTGGGMYNNGSGTGNTCSPLIRNCLFQGNSATAGGAIANAGYTGGSSSPSLINCAFQRNAASDRGGAILSDGSVGGNSNPSLINCSFQSNTATNGGAIYNAGYQGTGRSSLINCSFQSNSATAGGAIYSTGYQGNSGSTLTNCVVWGNGGASTFYNFQATINTQYSLFQASVTGYVSGTGNLTTTVSPFVSGSDGQIYNCSPAVNTGDNTANTSATDLAGNARIYGSRIDMGAYEYQGAGGLTVTIPSVNTATVGEVFGPSSFTAGGGSGPYSYSLASGSLPPGLSLSTTGVLSGTPTQSGSFTITVRATDANGCSGESPAFVQPVDPASPIRYTALNPARNGHNAPASTNVAITFNHPISNGTATLGAVRVFSQQRGGQLRNGQGGSTSASGNTLTFDPTTNFRPGETILTTVTSQAQSSAGANLVRGQVHQFTVGVGGTGGGNFTAPATNPNPAVGVTPHSVVLGDVDGDGDLDLLTAIFGDNVSVRLNNGSGNFTPHPTNPNPAVGNLPWSVVLGDVDGDGDLDLLTANLGSSTVSVLLNNGSGNFTPHPTNPAPAVGSGPRSVVLGDVDGDGDLDLLTANLGSDNVSVRLNDGSGNFTAPATNPNPAVGSHPQSVALGDVDGDGDLDFIATNAYSDNVSVRLNDGSGNFTPHPTNPNPTVSYGPHSVVLGDVDGDGDLDLLTATGYDNVNVRLNNGSGNFTAPATNPNPAVGSYPQSVVLGDVDGDGDLDFIAANAYSNTVSVRLNNGSGNFTPHPTNPDPDVGSYPASVVLGDVDGDGDLDLLTANTNSDNVSVRLNQLADLTITTLSPARNGRNAPASTNVAITFNHPISNGTATLGAVRVFSQQRGGQLRNGQGGSTSASGNTLTFDPTTNFRPGETILTTVTSQAQSSAGANLVRGQVHQFTVGVGGTGGGNFTAPATNPNPAVGSGPQSVALGDVDGDGDLDFIAANAYSNTVSVRLNSGSGNFTAPATNPNPAVGNGPQSVALGDVDGDGDLDLLTANLGSSTVSVLLNNGSGNFTAPATNPNPAVGSGPWIVVLGDVDGDGDLDLLTANINSLTVSIRLNNGSGSFTPHPTNPNPAVGSGTRGVVLGDVDGDGDLDFITANSGDDNVSVRLNDGSGNFTAPATNPNPAVGDGPISVMLGDVDGDGDLDLLTANRNSNTVSVRLNNGSGNFTAPATNPNPAVGSYPQSVVLGDVDGDGDLDLLTANANSNTVSVLLNNGSGNFTPHPTTPAVGNGPTNVALGDVDGDGDLDFIAANASSDNVSVRLNQPLAPTIAGFAVTVNPVCVNSPITFTATVGSLTGAYTYTLTNGTSGAPTSTITGSSSNTAFSQNLIASSANLQSFTLTVSNNGQTTTATTTLTVNTPPTASLQASGPLTCTTTSVTLTASGGATYSFSGPGLVSQDPVSGTAVANASGLYSVTVTSAGGCSATATTSLSSNTTPPTATILTPASTTITCTTTSISLTATGGGTYRWDNTSTNAVRSITTGGTYSLTVTAPNGCTALTTQAIAIDTPPPSASIAQSSATLSCTTSSVSLSAVGSGTYRWSTGATTSSISVSAAGTYSLSLTGANGCLATASTNVSYQNCPPAVANTISSQSATVGTAFSYTIPANTFTDPETPNSLTLSVTGLPATLSFVSPNTITGVPSTTVGSPFAITVVAVDGSGGSVSTVFSLNVVNSSGCGNMYTLKSGTWNDGSVWSCGRVPVSTDVVTLNHTVSLPASYQGQALRVIYSPGSRLVLSATSQLRLGGN
ncbi:VCBS repeat-containing protein [Spirosoma sp. BT702]|uniref:VCBS repeat-containing protein n=1 Tax=Spirosoma profusum TaxID=2771354 RepID=A0A927GA14_9BACT|nr:FG-GAP-like repeat-containing protein [Spirosoma profusum]MBD2705172.1 VCBS repeat-containing protein [Spirosoma profusum]